ncbi:hypothetical protein M9458_002183, partial [Cirrhinus mrigala]
PGKEAGTFICKTHTSTEKPLTVPTTNITATPPKTQSTFISKTDQNASGGNTGKASLTPTSKLGWLSNKNDRTPTREVTTTPTPVVQLTPAPNATPTPATRTTPTPATRTTLTPVPKTTPTPETTTVKTTFSPRTPTEPLKPVSNSAQKNQEARKR